MFVVLVSQGEGFHNYHHTFPSDYSTSEFGFRYNLTTMFIDSMAWIGLAEHRRKISPEAVLHRQQRTGDGSLGVGHSGVGKVQQRKLHSHTHFEANNNEYISK
jgi:stearoyl-CoA desaturase (delta-9 desaturase)